MKLAVFSDSHGRPAGMLRAISACSPDMIIHLGDGGSDIGKIKKQFPQIPLKAVRGNCDYSSNLPETELLSVNGVKLFLTHGHLFGVKHDIRPLAAAAHNAEADIVMYGHTHTADKHMDADMLVLNPGSCGAAMSLTFAVLVIGDGGDILWDIREV
ncbi:MAG: YfcE family phosphodiesterase [Oscillospiraceae bacterium]